VINQQVNLFQPIFRKEQKLLSFRVLLQGSTAVVVLLLLMYGWGLRQSAQIQADLAQLKAQAQQRSALLTQVSNRLAQMKTDTAPQLELARLEKELVARQKVVDALNRVRDSYTKGVSGYLESFSRQAPKGVWLTGFTVQAGGEGLVIRGNSLRPELVPAFLQQLSSEKTLNGTAFRQLQIQRQEDNAGYVNFTVYTGTEVPPLEKTP
jgi:hypothetical protein